MQVGVENEENSKFDSNHEVKSPTHNFIVEFQFPSKNDISTPVRSKSSKCINMKSLELNENVTNTGLQKNRDIKKFISRDLLYKIDNPSPLICFRNSESNEQSPDSEIYLTKMFNSSEINRQKIEFPAVNYKNTSYELNQNNYYLSHVNESDSPYYPLNYFNYNYSQNAGLSPKLHNKSFYQQAFSPTHFTPNFYEEIRSINKSNEEFISNLNLNEQIEGSNQIPLHKHQSSGQFHSRNKYDDFDFKKNPDRPIIDNNELIYNYERKNSDQKKKEFKEREGDWPCIICKNLNFKFRKVCNRCRMPKENSKRLFNKYLENLALYSNNDQSNQQFQLFNQIYLSYNNNNNNSYNNYPQNIHNHLIQTPIHLGNSNTDKK
jgi:hypothetical protein